MSNYSIHNTEPNVYTLQYNGIDMFKIGVSEQGTAAEFIDLVQNIVAIWNIARPQEAIEMNAAARKIADTLAMRQSVSAPLRPSFEAEEHG